VCFGPAEGYVSTPIYDRYRLPAAAQIPGPAVLEEFDSTVVIHPGYQGLVDDFGSIHLVPQEQPAGPAVKPLSATVVS
jgi:N-methylhydantoinase A